MSDPRLFGRIKTDGTSADEIYFKDWPLSSCPYIKDINWGCSIGIQYLTKISAFYKPGGKFHGKIGLVIFDFDECLCFGDVSGCLSHKEMDLGTISGQGVFLLPPNTSVVKMAETAKSLGFKIVVLTARPEESKLATLYNLVFCKIPYDMLLMNSGNSDPQFKVKTRRQLTKPNQDIVLTVGDQWTDLYLPGSNTAAIKLPEPELKCAYAYIP